MAIVETPPGEPESKPDPEKEKTQEEIDLLNGTQRTKEPLKIESLHAVETRFQLETPGPNLGIICSRPPNGWYYFLRPTYYMVRTSEQNGAGGNAGVKKYVTVWKEVQARGNKEKEYPIGSADNPCFFELSLLNGTWYKKSFKVFRIANKKLGFMYVYDAGGEDAWKCMVSNDDGKSWESGGSIYGWVSYFHYGYVSQRMQQRDGLLSIICEDYTTDGGFDNSAVSTMNGFNTIRRPFGSPLVLVRDDTIISSAMTEVCAGIFLEMEDTPSGGGGYPFTAKLYVWWNDNPYYPYNGQPNWLKPIFPDSTYVFNGYPKELFTGVMSYPNDCIPRMPITNKLAADAPPGVYEHIRWEDSLTWEFYWTGSGGSKVPGTPDEAASRYHSVPSPLSEIFSKSESEWLGQLRSVWDNFGFSWGRQANAVMGPYQPYGYYYSPYIGFGQSVEIYFDTVCDSRGTYVRMATDGSYRTAVRMTCFLTTGNPENPRDYSSTSIAGFIGNNPEAVTKMNRHWLYIGNGRVIGCQVTRTNGYVQINNTGDKYFATRQRGYNWEIAGSAERAFFGISLDNGVSYAPAGEIVWSSGFWEDIEWDTVHKYAGANISIFFDTYSGLTILDGVVPSGLGAPITPYTTYEGDYSGAGFLGIPRPKVNTPLVGPPDPNAQKESGYWMYTKQLVGAEIAYVTETIAVTDKKTIECSVDVQAISSITIMSPDPTIEPWKSWVYASNAGISNKTVTLNAANELPEGTTSVKITYTAKQSYNGTACIVEVVNIIQQDRIYVSQPVETVLYARVLTPSNGAGWTYDDGASTKHMNIIYLGSSNYFPSNADDIIIAYNHTWKDYNGKTSLPYTTAVLVKGSGQPVEEARIFEAQRKTGDVPGVPYLLELEHGLDLEEPTFYDSTYNSGQAATLNITPVMITFAQNIYDVYSFSSGGGFPPIVWVMSGGTLPAGLTWDAAHATISGTPTATGVASVTLQATDSNTTSKATASAVISISIGAVAFKVGPQAQSFTTNVYGSVEFTLQLIGGAGTLPYNWTCGGSVPTGMSWDADTHTIKGTPTVAGSWQVTVTVRDSSAPELFGSTICGLVVQDPAP